MTIRRLKGILLAVCASVVLAGVSASCALAVAQSPRWTVTAFSDPTNFAPGTGTVYDYTVLVRNAGGAASDGSTVDISDILPAGLTAAPEGASGREQIRNTPLACTGVSCSYAGVVEPDEVLAVTVPVTVDAGAPPSVVNRVTVSGGGAPEASVETPTAITSAPAAFGIAPGSTAGALSSTLAGAHADVSTSLEFTTAGSSLEAERATGGGARETVADLPPGFAGDVADTPKCPIATFDKGLNGSPNEQCPLSTQVGTVTVTIRFRNKPTPELETSPVYNVVANPGEVAKLAFSVGGFAIVGTVSLRPGDYGIRTRFQDIQQVIVEFEGVTLTVWGVPAEHSHDALRGAFCGSGNGCEYCQNVSAGRSHCRPFGEVDGLASTGSSIPYLTNPTQCSGSPLSLGVAVNSWEDPEQTLNTSVGMDTLTGCNLLEFAPSLVAAPDTSRGDTPAGLTAEVRVPEEGLLTGEGSSSADIQNTTVTLPEGLAINPGQAAGLGACQFSQDGIGQEGPPSCPSNSRVGHVEIETPVLKEKLQGEVYVLQSNPPNLKLLVTASAPTYGIYVKFIGSVHLNEATGQLTTTFAGTPELPFTDFKLEFSGGAQAALTTPATCGLYGVNSDFQAWSAPFTTDSRSTGAFAIESGPGGSPCASPLPFSPSMIAGSTTDQAGGDTDFSLLLTRGDGQQRVGSLQFKTPPGLLGRLSQVQLCGEPQASQGACGAGSQIGHTVVEAGPGPYPLVVPQPGSPPAPIYITGPYEGAPFGLSIVVPVVVGPFNLGTIVVRARIEVDPTTSQLTITTDPLPVIVDGVPTDLRTINAVIDRPGFMFNPTDCNPSSFSGTATSTQGTAVPISSAFQVGSCQSLPFKPGFKAFTSARTSLGNGASLDVRVTSGAGQANIAKTVVVLPKQLPARLTTIQKACLEATFAANPAACPAASAIGWARAVTPILAGPVQGPVYLVSHGGAAFPDVVMILQGEGVTVDVVGAVNIKGAITTASFDAIPDVPLTTFELSMPEGPHSGLATNLPKSAKSSMCGQPLTMPTTLTGQDGAVVQQTTKIAVTGCPKAKKASGRARGARAARRARARALARRAQVAGHGHGNQGVNR
jgi:uncharacterized repeat protein (TIGR01451 family)